MPDFSKLLAKPVADAKKPPPMPAGTYPGVIKQWTTGDNNRNKTPYVRFTIGLVGWPDEVADEDKEGIDLSKRQQSRDFYLTEEADWRLARLINSMGIDSEGRVFGETLPETIGGRVLVEIKQELNQETNEVYNTVGNVVGDQG